MSLQLSELDKDNRGLAEGVYKHTHGGTDLPYMGHVWYIVGRVWANAKEMQRVFLEFQQFEVHRSCQPDPVSQCCDNCGSCDTIIAVSLMASWQMKKYAVGNLAATMAEN